MYQLLPAKFRFALFLIEQSSYRNNTTVGEPTICYADTYDIKDDGSIIFYQTGISPAENKRVKIPVAVYPHGKWEACILINDQDQYPIFQNNTPNTHVNHGKNQEVKPAIIQQEHIQATIDNEDELDSLTNLFDNKPIAQVTPQQPLINSSIQPNSPEFKKLKTEFLEVQIKEYIKQNAHFHLNEFEDFLSHNHQFEIFKINETDILWTASTLIRDKLVLARKFSDPLIQKTLALILPDIMRRQWTGKIGPIIQILTDREETKYVNAIDLAVWMIQTGFE
jgi:hypothetical protein